MQHERRKLLTRIQTLRTDLHLNDSDYRNLIYQTTGINALAEMKYRQLEKLIRTMENLKDQNNKYDCGQ